EVAYILEIKIYRDRSKRLIGLCQNAYIGKILKRFYMENSKRGTIPMQEKLKLSKSQGASTPAEKQRMQNIPYASPVGSIMYAVRCTRPDTVREFYTCKQEEGQYVSSHVLKMKGYIDNLERLGQPVGQNLSVSLILVSLNQDFNSFVQNYNMHDMGQTVNELHAMLKLHEETLPKKDANPALHAIQAGRVQKNQKNKPHKVAKGGHGKGKGKMGYALNNAPFAPKPKTPLPPKKDNPAKDAIFHQCGEVGNWRRNCPAYLAELMKKKKLSHGASTSGIFTIELYSFPSKSWIYDTGYGTHICIATEGLRGSKKLKPGALSLYVGDGHRAAVEAIRTYHLELPSGLVIVLNNCHYAPSITRGVISVSHLFDDGFINRFDDNNVILVSKNNLVYFIAVPRDGQCVSCMSGKMARKPYSHQVERAKDLLGLIHTDVCGPFKIVSRQGASYFVTFTDDFSRYGYVYLLKHKHEVFETFKVFQKEVENHHRKTIKSLHSDCGGKYMSQEFLDHLKEHGIIAHRTPPYTPQNNEVSERRNQTLLDMVRSMMSQTTLPNSFWDYAIETAARILNMVSTKKVEKTPYEIWNGQAPKLSYLKVWGCEAFVKRDTLTKPDKLDPRSFKCIFVGYPKEKIRYSFYSPSENKVFVARIAEFFKSKLLDLKASGSVEDLELIQEEDTNPSVDTSLNHEEDDQEIKEPQSDINPIRKSSMTRRAPDRMCLYIDAEEHELRDLGEPANYKAALLDPESKKWLDAMNNPGEEHLIAVKNILKYLRNTKDMFLVYGGNIERELRVSCYTDAGYLTDADNQESQTGYVFTLNGGVVDWKSTKQSIFATSSTDAEYIATFDASKEAKDDGVTKGARHFRAKVHYLRETIKLVDVKIEKIDTYYNLAHPFTMALAFPKHSELTRNIGLLSASSIM
nr:hypothetical protein [Tanacetum cinerariifolium]